MRVLLTGATGLIGEKLSAEILSKGHELIILSRSSESQFREGFTLPCSFFQWEHPTTELPPKEALLQADAVIHLAGESIAQGRWTDEKKKRIYDSRVKSTQNLVKALAELEKQPEVIVGGSAIGYYGDGGEQILDESSPSGRDFLAKTCVDWEKAWQPLEQKSRVVYLRTGVVLSARGGFLGALEPVFSSGLGGVVGSGKQWVSWIHEEDLVALIIETLANEKYRGAVNGVAPNAVRNVDLTKELGRAHKMPALVPVPEIALRTLLGEMSILALASQQVLPGQATQNDFSFKYYQLSEALEEIYSWKQSAHDRLFYAEQWVPESIEKVFPFFSQAENLETITPPFLNFRVLNKSTENMEEGTVINYQLKIHGVPARWQSRIEKWRVNHCFQDIQLKGPYKKWEHLHGFRKLAGGVLLYDQVVFRLPLGFLSKGPMAFFVRKDVGKIFSYRQKRIAEIFGEKS